MIGTQPARKKRQLERKQHYHVILSQTHKCPVPSNSKEHIIIFLHRAKVQPLTYVTGKILSEAFVDFLLVLR